jgi:UDP-glucose 4-epimerase
VFPTSESHHPYNDRTFYGAAKGFNEGMLRSFYSMYGLNYVALRYWNVYGPRMDIFGVYTEVLIRWMERIAASQPPLILGDGTQTMDLVFVEDVAKANVLAAQKDITNEAFNVASGQETSLNDLAKMLLKVMGSDLQPEYGPARQVNLAQRRLADIRKADQMLGFRAGVSVEDGLHRLVTWWREERLESEKVGA